ncbi:TetR/AcrR family transcriptional regulator [bacterium]|nr:TetR/AcrR family transcriptional regulator [bacterium]
MAEKDRKDARQRILDASVSLFSRKGFAGVGVREIANEAGVNLAMISYYFNGKTGILKEIIEQFFNLYLPIFIDADDPGKTPEACFRHLIRKIVHFIRENTDLFLLVYNEIPLDVPEVAEIKSRRIGELLERIGSLMMRFGLDPADRAIMAVIGPTLISATLAQFRLRPVMHKIFQVKPDEKYYEHYVDTICTLFLSGVAGLRK